MSSSIKVIGIDISLNNLGIAYGTLELGSRILQLDDLKLIEAPPEADKKTKKVVRQNIQDLARAKVLYGGMMLACSEAKLAFVEIPVGSQSARAMASYGVCVGVLAACPIPIIAVTPTEVKVSGAGPKTATKEEMIAWALAKYPAANWLRYDRGGKGYKKGDVMAKNEHLADAVAAIHAGIASDQYLQLESMLQNFSAAG